MFESARHLLHDLIDYAGLFPPSQLDMRSTVENYARYLVGDHAWLLGRLVLPVSRLEEFDGAAASVLPRGAEPWRLSVVTVPAGDERFSADLARVQIFNQSHSAPTSGLAVIAAIELRADTPVQINDVLSYVPDDLLVFFELPIDQNPRALIAALAGTSAGAKIRTGGARPEDFPSVSDVARFISACASYDIPFKASAGLQRPIRHWSERVQAWKFGFVNILVASALASQHKPAPKNLIESVLGDESTDAFTFNDTDLTWRDNCLTLESIDRTRDLFLSFGCCSFDEPRDGFTELLEEQLNPAAVST